VKYSGLVVYGGERIDTIVHRAHLHVLDLSLSPDVCAHYLHLIFNPLLLQGTKRPDSGIVKSSQFSSSEQVAGKVGVVNSGKGMTEFEARKRHKFDAL
jgi:hypothetical protein